VSKGVTLSTMNRGAAEELFQAELQKVMENIQDINTEAKAKRTITISLVFVPNETREEIGLEIAVGHKPAQMRGTSTRLYSDGRKVAGRYEVVEYDPKQLRFAEMAPGCVHPVLRVVDGICKDCGEIITAAKESA
jgi:hypothetical protein